MVKSQFIPNNSVRLFTLSNIKSTSFDYPQVLSPPQLVSLITRTMFYEKHKLVAKNCYNALQNKHSIEYIICIQRDVIMGKCNRTFGYTNSLKHVIHDKFTAQYGSSSRISMPQHSCSFSDKPKQLYTVTVPGWNFELSLRLQFPNQYFTVLS